MMARKWFQLVDEDGSPVVAATSANIEYEDVDSLRKGVKKEFNDTFLAGIAAAELVVFATGAQPLEDDAPLRGLGTDKSSALIVRRPYKEQPRDITLWLVHGSIANSLDKRGVRSQVYTTAAAHFGYYDPRRAVGDEPRAIWYEGSTLRIQVLFKIERDAQLFKYEVDKGTVTVGSALLGQEVATEIRGERVTSDVSNTLRQISFKDNVAQESDSPQQSISARVSTTSIVDVVTDEFKYQGIESIGVLGSLGKYHGCHISSAAHCRDHASYHAYDRDPNNRLYLSQDLHGFYDGTNVAVPTVNILFGNASAVPAFEDRYEVKLIVRALNTEYGQIISRRLKEGSTVSSDFMEMTTTVYVTNPVRFRKYLKWKAKRTEKAWRDYLDMVPAVN